jgi:aryl carrier-like protein
VGTVEDENNSEDDFMWTNEIEEELKQSCKLKLTDYMIPQHYTYLKQIPLSPNGKVERQRLPLPKFFKSNSSSSLFLSQENKSSSSLFNENNNNNNYNNNNNIVDKNEDGKKVNKKEEILINLWSLVLNIQKHSIVVDSNFFSIGGDSLRCLQLVAQAKKNGVIISVPQVFNNPTIRKLASVASFLNDGYGPEVLGIVLNSYLVIFFIVIFFFFFFFIRYKQ